MLLLHLTPFNEFNTPYRLDFLQLTEDLQSHAKGSIIIAPPLGELPNPQYAVAMAEDLTVAIKQQALSYAEAGVKLEKLITPETQIVFSNALSLRLFKRLLSLLLLPNLLANKQCTSFKALLNASVLLRNVFTEQEAKSLKGLGLSLGAENKTVIDSVFAILKQLYLKNAKLTHYFLCGLGANSLPNTLLLENSKIFIALTDSQAYLIMPICRLGGTLTAWDLAKPLTPEYSGVINLPLDGSVMLAPASTVPEALMTKLSLKATEVNSLKGRLLTELENRELVKDLLKEHPAKPDESNQLLNSPSYLALSSLHLDLLALNQALAKTRGQLRELALDYLWSSNRELMDSPLIQAYRIIIEERLNSKRSLFTEQFNSCLTRAKTETDQERLKNLYSFLEEQF